ncbi:MAG: GNAT family N-acetyltransferase [Anaerolineae bacterium]
MENRDLSTSIILRDGRQATVRPLEASDVESLTNFFLGLSERTRSRYGPHPFDRATAEKLCASINLKLTIRFITLLEDGPLPQIVGYIILSREIWGGDVERYKELISFDDTACFAPVIADAFQDQGVGSQMGRHVLASASKIGLKRVILMGGVMAENEIARHVYQKLGFRQLGEFITHQNGDVHNYDMMIEL